MYMCVRVLPHAILPRAHACTHTHTHTHTHAHKHIQIYLSHTHSNTHTHTHTHNTHNTHTQAHTHTHTHMVQTDHWRESHTHTHTDGLRNNELPLQMITHLRKPHIQFAKNHQLPQKIIAKLQHKIMTNSHKIIHRSRATHTIREE